MGTQPPLSQHRKRDRILGLSIIVLAFGGCMGLSVWGMRVSTPQPAPAPLPASKEDIDGFPHRVHPFDVLPRARTLTVRQRFRGFEAVGVKPDGSIDLTEDKSSIRFAFQSPQGRGPQPEREPGTLPTRRYCGTQSVVIENSGIAARPDRPQVPCGGREIDELVVPRHCSIEQLWQIARKKKIKTKGTATIEYFQAQDGPAYRFVKDKRSFVVSALDCKNELKGRAQRGSIPRP